MIRDKLLQNKCSHPGCTKTARFSGLCEEHYWEMVGNTTALVLMGRIINELTETANAYGPKLLRDLRRELTDAINRVDKNLAEWEVSREPY